MFSWQSVILISGLMSGVSQVMGKGLVNKKGALQVGFWREVGTTVIYLLFLVVYGVEKWSVGSFLPVFLYGVILAASIAAFYSATREDLSGTSVFASSMGQILIVLFSAVIFQEWVYFDPGSQRGVINMLAVVMGMGALIVYQGGFTLSKVKWSKLLMFSVLVNVFGNLFVKGMIEVGVEPVLFMLYSNMGMFVGTAVLMKRRGQGYLLGKISTRRAILQGLISGVSVMMYLLALENNPLSLASTIRRVATMMLVVGVGLFYYKERKSLGARQWVSLGAGFVVYLLVAVANR